MTRSRHSGGLASLTKRVWSGLTLTFARCASRTAPMKSTIVRLHARSCANTPTRRFNSQASGPVAQGIKQDEEYAGVKPIEERHRINEAGLDPWMRQNIEDYLGLLNVLLFEVGQSNPNFRSANTASCSLLVPQPFREM